MYRLQPGVGHATSGPYPSPSNAGTRVLHPPSKGDTTRGGVLQDLLLLQRLLFLRLRRFLLLGRSLVHTWPLHSLLLHRLLLHHLFPEYPLLMAQFVPLLFPKKMAAGPGAEE